MVHFGFRKIHFLVHLFLWILNAVMRIECIKTRIKYDCKCRQSGFVLTRNHWKRNNTHVCCRLECYNFQLRIIKWPHDFQLSIWIIEQIVRFVILIGFGFHKQWEQSTTVRQSSIQVVRQQANIRPIERINDWKHINDLAQLVQLRSTMEMVWFQFYQIKCDSK